MTEHHDEASPDSASTRDPGPATASTLDITVRDNPESQTYDALIGDEIAGTMLYEIEGPRLVLTHTAVQQRFQHQGVANTLIGAALDDIRTKGKRITIICPIVKTFIDGHPAYADLIDAEHPGVS
jgi:predicted GNAT family acetyltransferase